MSCSLPRSFRRSRARQIVEKSGILWSKPIKFQNEMRSWHWYSSSGSLKPYHDCNNMQRTMTSSSVCGLPPISSLSSNASATIETNGFQSICSFISSRRSPRPCTFLYFSFRMNASNVMFHLLYYQIPSRIYILWCLSDMIEGLIKALYSVFIPCSIDNINNILAGRSFKFSTANIDEDKAGHVQSIYSQSLENHMGTVQDLVMLMPRKRISGVSSVDVRIGDALFPQVKSSNPDDEGVVEIASITGGSIVTYHPEKSEQPQPLFQWGSGGWTNPLKVKVEASRLFFDERNEHERPDGKLWLLDFQRDGYRATSL